ncbi:MAG: hypothetical protein GYB65_20675, partial [Chloroflexi bacterium]|nr:hypothetical protein [Chloroflexota bacterium]
MKIQYTIDDSAARLPLSIRSAEGVWDREADLRNAPGVHLVELTTQHMQNTGATLTDELTGYFNNGHPSEADPYALADCFANREQLEDLLRDLRHVEAEIVALNEVEALFPVMFMHEMTVMLALTTVGYPAFGYVRTYRDSEGESYHGMVVNLAQARPHLEERLGQFSFSLLTDVIRCGFFNHQGFLLAYDVYCQATKRAPDGLVAQLKDAALRRGIAWFLSYRHNLAFYDETLGFDADRVGNYVQRWNDLVELARDATLDDESFEDWLRSVDQCEPTGMLCVDALGLFVARTLFDAHGNKGLRDAITEGPDHFITSYNAL